MPAQAPGSLKPFLKPKQLNLKMPKTTEQAEQCQPQLIPKNIPKCYLSSESTLQRCLPVPALALLPREVPRLLTTHLGNVRLSAVSAGRRETIGIWSARIMRPESTEELMFKLVD